MRFPFRASCLIVLAAACVLLAGCHDGVYHYSVGYGYSGYTVHHGPHHYDHGHHHHYRPRHRHRHHYDHH